MNERIERILKQATVVTEGWSDENGTTRYYNVDQEKFAMLIVQECMNVLHDNELWNRHISHALKEHFGVEE